MDGEGESEKGKEKQPQPNRPSSTSSSTGSSQVNAAFLAALAVLKKRQGLGGSETTAASTLADDAAHPSEPSSLSSAPSAPASGTQQPASASLLQPEMDALELELIQHLSSFNSIIDLVCDLLKRSGPAMHQKDIAKDVYSQLIRLIAKEHPQQEHLASTESAQSEQPSGSGSSSSISSEPPTSATTAAPSTTSKQEHPQSSGIPGFDSAALLDPLSSQYEKYCSLAANYVARALERESTKGKKGRVNKAPRQAGWFVLSATESERAGLAHDRALAWTHRLAESPSHAPAAAEPANPPKKKSTVPQHVIDAFELLVKEDKMRKKYQHMKAVVSTLMFANSQMADQVLKAKKNAKRLKLEARFLAQRLSVFEKVSLSEDEDDVSSSSGEEDDLPRKLPLQQRQHQVAAATTGRGENGDAMDERHAGSPFVSRSQSPATVSGSLLAANSSASAGTGSTAAGATAGTGSGSPASGLSSSAPSSSASQATASGSSRRKKVYAVPLDESGNAILPFTVSSVTVHSLGKIVYDREAYHSDKSIWPVGYESSRVYHSAKDPNGRTVYRMRILDGGDAPKFEIRADDDPDNPYAGASATACYVQLIEAVNKVRGKAEFSTTGSATTFFGYVHPTVVKLIQELPNARKCTKYVFQELEWPTSNFRQEVSSMADSKGRRQGGGGGGGDSGDEDAQATTTTTTSSNGAAMSMASGSAAPTTSAAASSLSSASMGGFKIVLADGSVLTNIVGAKSSGGKQGVSSSAAPAGSSTSNTNPPDAGDQATPMDTSPS